MWILVLMCAVGVLLVTVGTVAFLRERRRLMNAVLFLAGLAVTGLSLLLIASRQGWFAPWPDYLALAMLALPVLGYPVLAVFLVVNGLTMARRESRSLGNLLSLLLGLGMVAAPLVLLQVDRLLDPQGWASSAWTALLVFLIGLAAYVGFCFVAFLGASWAYGHLPLPFRARYVVILGSGLIGDRVPPLLAARLDKAVEVGREQAAATGEWPVLIPSGGQGADELVAEGVAMAAYLREHGVPEDRVLVEDRAETTLQNLRLSQALMDDPAAPTVVVTTGYHVFRAAILTRLVGLNARVRGARTASYYVPSAFLREFIAVIRMHLRINLLLVALWSVLIIGMLLESFRGVLF